MRLQNGTKVRKTSKLGGRALRWTTLLVGLFVVGMVFFQFGLQSQTPEVVWWDALWDYRTPVKITTGNYGSEDVPISWNVDLAGKLAAMQTPPDIDPLDPNSVRVIEYNPDGTVLGEVPSQFSSTPALGSGIAVIQFSDSYTSTTVGPALTALGYSFTDVTADLEAGTLDYQTYSFVLIDSFATSREEIRNALDADTDEIQTFVSSGGVVMMMAQANQDLNGGITSPNGGPAGAVVWAPLTMKYSDVDGDVYPTDPAHDLWTVPNNPVDPNGMGGLPCWEGLAEWDAAYAIRASRCTDGTCVAPDPVIAAYAELPYFAGSFLFTAIAADVRYGLGTAPEQAVALDMLENMLEYGLSLVGSGTPPDPELLWMLDGVTGPNTDRHFYVYFDSWDGVDTGTQKAAPAYVTDLSTTGTIVENEHFRFDIGGFTDWTVKDLGLSAPEVWGPPDRVWNMSNHLVFGTADLAPVPATLTESGPIRSRVLLSPSQGAVMEMTFYAGAPYYERTVLALPTDPSSISLNDEQPGGIDQPVAQASGVAAYPYAGDLPSETDFQPTPTAVSGTAHAWAGVYDTADQAGYAEIAAMIDVIHWGMEQGGPMSANEYDATRLPVRTWSYYFQYGTTVPLVVDLATQRFANPPALAEEELIPTLIDAGSDLTVDEGETINFNGWVSPDVENPTYDWDFGDTNSATGTPTPTHAYEEQGVYTVDFTVESSSHSPLGDSLQVTVLNVAPIVDAGPDQEVLIGTPVLFNCGFTDPGVLDTHTFEWDFDDGDTDDTTLTPSHTYLLPGSYTARCTVTDDDGDVGFDEVQIDIVEPTATALLNDGPAGGGSLIQGAAGDITLRNQLLAVTVAAVTEDDQLAGEGLGHVLDGAPTGLLDGLDWVMLGYFEPTHTEGATAWDIHNVRYTTPVITDPGTAHAQVTADGTYIDGTGAYAGVTLTTTYDLDPLDEYVTITTVLTNTTGAPIDFWFGDVMDFDGTPPTVQNSYIPGVGLISTGDGGGQPFEQWAGQWGTGPEAYALHYEDPVLFYGPNSWLKSAWPFHLEATGDPDDTATFVRHLIITDSSSYPDHVAAIEAIVSTFPAPVPASPTFTVTDSVSGALLEGAVVSLESALGGITTGFTDVTGQVTIDVIPGDYTMRASRPGYFASTPQVLTLPEGGSAWAVQLDQRPEAGIEYVILVVSDGLTWDILNAQAPAEIMSMITTGAAATHGVSEVPSVTATNTNTFNKGTHSSTHGVVGNAYVNSQSESNDTIQAAVARGGLTYENLSSASAIISKINDGTLASHTRWWWGQTDHESHVYGPDSPQYATAIQQMSTYIGQIMTALQNSTSGIDTGNTVLGLGSDHGHQPLVPVGIAAPDPSCLDATPWDCRVIDARYVIEQAGIVVDTWRASGPRMAHVYLNNPADGPAAKAALEARAGVHRAYLRAELNGTDLSAIAPDVVAYLNHPNSGDVIAFVEAEYSMGRSVVQSAADPVPAGRNYYWDCADNYRGGHGGITAQESYVPFVLWGDAIDPGCSLGARPNADWAPTVTALLGIDPPLDSEGSAAVECLACTDTDGDGFNSCAGDCDDDNPDIFPGALELCDGEDNDCDGEVDSGLTGTVFSMPDDATAAPGETVIVPIIVTPANGIAVDLHIAFDPLVLQLTDVLKTPISDPPGLQDFSLTITPDNISGTLIISLFGVMPPLTGTGPLLDLEFTVIGAVGETSPLDFTYALINEAQIPYCVDHGRFTGCDDVDDDGDGFSECDGDCDDNDINNWNSCGTCVDGDSDLYYTGCDAYDTILGPDCDDVDPDINPGETDDDCDGVDEDCTGVDDDGYLPTASSCGLGVCASTGLMTCVSGALLDTCSEGTPTGTDDQCDGLDNDCDGTNDDEYVPTPTTCGVGECAGNTGTLECQAGLLEDTCDPLDGALPDDQCDGLDNDCDGTNDDEYVPAPTTCGVGECAGNTGTLECQAGSLEDTCDPLGGALPDDQCDGLDNDCDGTNDDEYVPTPTTCGVGECAGNTGTLECQAGLLEDTCDPLDGALPDDQCDGLDNDCDGTNDDEYVPTPTTCGVGECAGNTGTLECQAGLLEDACDPLDGALPDDQCDGLDNDCDGTNDDEYVPTPTTCGVGECVGNTGTLECQAGLLEDTCDPLDGALPDDQCDGLDNDCDGTNDDEYVPTPTTCGVGECAGNTGTLECQAGLLEDTCDPLGGALPDDQCDGLDNDCDGTNDDEYVPTPTTCGVGECAGNTGTLECQAGLLEDTCDPLDGALPDDQCDGLDNDCDGTNDDEYVPTPTTCGVGECAGNTGTLECQAGLLEDTCDPLDGALPDDQCDGLDNDCDGTNDDEYVPTPTTCGVGECVGNTGTLECQAGLLEDTCDPLDGALPDDQCDGLDNDCDGTNDDEYVPTPTTCGVGECAGNTGTLECQAGLLEDTCDPLDGALPDDQCDGLDNDCDGTNDDEYVPTPTTCGVGECVGNTGTLECQAGLLEDTCDPLDGALPDDQCDGLDNDCDGTNDDEYVPTPTTCGVGECAGNTGTLECQAGLLEDTCDPLGGALPDDQCDGLDNDCDGTNDDEYVPTPTTCGVGECAGNTGTLECQAGLLEDTCDPLGGALPDDQCDGLDNDCDGTNDDEYVPTPTTCGVGECVGNTGTLECQAGSLEDTCDPNDGASAEVCDNVDNDCDGPVDEADGGGPLTQITTCGVGQCAGNEGVETCTGGIYTGDTCDPLFGATPDDQCDGVDNDCDGPADDDYVPTPTACGVGECLSAGLLTCVAGLPVDTCLPGLPETEICDGLDNNCDSNVDEDGAALCDDGFGCTMDVCNGASGCDYMDTCPGDQFCDLAGDICATTVRLPTIDVCTGGDLYVPVVVDSIDGLIGLNLGFSYDPLVLAPFEVLPAAASAGYAVTSNLTVPGEVAISLFSPIPGSGGGTVAWVHFAVLGATGSSTALQWLNSALDEGSVGAVEVDGQIDVTAASTSLSLPDDVAGTPGGTVIVPVLADPADGIGVILVVEFDPTVIQYVDATTTPLSSGFGIVKTLDAPGKLGISLFGVSPLSGSGSIVDIEFLVVGNSGDSSPLLLSEGEIDEGAIPSCLDDGFLRVCGSVAADDLTCDGVDDDCNGLVDDGYVSTGSMCGLGACAGNTGTLECIDGSVVDSCDPFDGAAADDATCDGIDEDCDGTDAEDYVTTPTTCGVGACDGNSGQLECQDGSEVDTCDPLAGATADDQCDNLDNDCDGSADDDYIATPTSCGVGQCAGNVGVLACVDGTIDDTCDPLLGATEEICDGVDNDCDDVVDDGPSAGDIGDEVRFGPNPTVITWADLPNSNVYNVYKGNISSVGPFSYDHICYEPESPDARTEDTAIPAAGQVFYYLVSALNSCQGEDTLGTDSSGTARPNDNPCPNQALDSDLDGHIDINDNCPLEDNPGQEDQDIDGVGDVCDNCPTTTPGDQRDRDDDGIGNICDACTDSDADGFGDPGFPVNTCDEDNCPLNENPGQEDQDVDGLGDVCDACDNDPDNDIDLDGVCGDLDICPADYDPDQEDADIDGVGDVCDVCTDIDGDGFGDPGFPANTCDDDNCPGDDNPGQEDPDADGVGSLCDICPDDFDPSQTDLDFDTLGDACDPCPSNPDPACQPCPPGDDSDGDGICSTQEMPVDLGGAMDYRANGDDPLLGLTWTEQVFTLPGDWQSGTYGVGYDVAGEHPHILNTSVPTGAFSIYTRATFDVADPGAVVEVRIGADYGDAYVAWLNGTEIYRSPEMPAGVPDWNTLALNTHEASSPPDPYYHPLVDVTVLAALQPVGNVLAVGVWNDDPGSDALILVPQLTIATSVDNCVFVSNPDQTDTDGDGLGDACDVD